MYEPLKDETKEQYLKIWSHYAIGHLNQEQLAQLFNCSQDTIGNAISWCAKNRMKFSPAILVEAAKEALESRLRELRNDLVRIKEGNPINWNAVIGLNRLIGDTEESLWQFQAVIEGKGSITINKFQNNSGKCDYKVMKELEIEEEHSRKARELVDTWTEEEKKLFLLFSDATKPDRTFEIKKEGQITVITIKVIDKVDKQVVEPHLQT